MITLAKVLKNIPIILSKRQSDISINNICLDSRYIRKNDIFIAIEGAFNHGLDYLDQALDNGASVVLTDKSVTIEWKNIPIILINNLSDYLSLLVKNIYPITFSPKIIVVTGTNGKSSIVSFVMQLLNNLNISAISIGTLGVQTLGDGQIINLMSTFIYNE